MFKLNLSFCPGNIFNTKMILKVPEETGTTVHFWAGHQQSYYRQAEPCSLLVWGHGTLPDDHDITSSLCRETDTCPSIGPHKILWSWEQILLLLFLDKKTNPKSFIHLLKAHVVREDRVWVEDLWIPCSLLQNEDLVQLSCWPIMPRRPLSQTPLLSSGPAESRHVCNYWLY